MGYSWTILFPGHHTGNGGNSLDINQNYGIDKDLNFVAERTSNINVGFVNLLRKCDKPWMNRRVRSMNLQLDRTLMRCDMLNINVTDTDTVAREKYTTHGLHPNSRGKMRLTHFIVECICSGHMPSKNSSIPVITHARASRFLG
jgi:hypothetical protein